MLRNSGMLMAVGVAAAIAVPGCTTANGPTDPSITIPYNPYDFDPDELFAQAQAHCGAYGLSAVYVDETIDPSSVRWRYRHFDCR
ncbi:MAG: hypothetical protein AAF850_07230 [Pseudomonadota bacterium]